MKKFYNYMLAVLACLLLGTSTALAVDKEEVDFGNMELNKAYQMEDFKTFIGTFVAPKTGYLLVRATYADILKPYKERRASIMETVSDSENQYDCTQMKGYGTWTGDGMEENYLSAWEMPVEEGKTYYLATGSVMTKSKVVLTMDERDFVMTSTFGDADKVITPTVNGTLSFLFNRPVSYSSAILKIGNTQISVVGRTSEVQCSMAFELKTVLINQMRAGFAKTGDPFTLVVNGVKSADGKMLYQGSGVISMDFTLGDMPTLIMEESANFKENFLTWYESGDEKGIFTLTFNNPLSEDNKSIKALLRFGDSDQQDNGGYYQETANQPGSFTMKVVGNQIILDFTGKRRTIADMVTSTESTKPDAYKLLNLEISQVRDANGVKTYSESSSSSGKYNYSFNLDIPKTDVQSDFTPANGSNIDKIDEVEIWINDDSKLKYDGIDFVYTENSEEKVITVTDFDKVADVPEGDADDAVLITVKIPAEAKGHGSLLVRLHNVSCADGKDYSSVIAAQYVSGSTGIANVTVEGQTAVKVYDLNGQLVRQDKSLHGLHGVYVINGKKAVLK